MNESALKVNGQIGADSVMLVLPDGKNMGVIPIEKAKTMALEEELDLVEVSPAHNGTTSVCKLLDWQKFCYKSSKQHKQKHNPSTKEIKFGLRISDHDLDRKHRQVIKFLEKHFHVKYALELKGRRQKMSNEIVAKFGEQIKLFEEKAAWNPPSISDRSISVVLHPR